MKRDKWKNLVSKKQPLLTPVKRKCKGGFPCGTKPGQGGLAEVGGVAESVETSFWDMPFIKQIIGRDIYSEDEEQPVDNQKLAAELADKILALKKGATPEEVEEVVDEVVDEIDDVSEDPEDPDKMGLIRFVKGAHLVYKRQTEDGSYEELWVYQIDKLDSGSRLKKAILAGTDVELDTLMSADQKQQAELWTAGNAQMIKITGLPN